MEPAIAMFADLAEVTLKNYAGKRKVLNIVPGLDTPTCALSCIICRYCLISIAGS